MLFDYEQSSNVGNWQWVAGCGVDASPYFRIFNPYEQQKKFDKFGTYVKKWLPNDYKEQPIVDHKFARKKDALKHIKRLLINNGSKSHFSESTFQRWCTNQQLK